VNAPLAISSWSAVGPVGIGAEEYRAGILSGRSGTYVPGFDIRELLGRKNTRSMDRVTGLAVLTVSKLLDEERRAGQEPDGDSTGLVLGTTTGSIQSMMDFSRDSFTNSKPHLVDPARFPNAVMNRAAGQTAIWHGLRGPNTTVASGNVAGLSAFRYAARLCRSGHARTVLCGAVEELTALRAWLEGKRDDEEAPAPLGEGCAVFRLESPSDANAAGRPVRAHLLATAFRMYGSPPDIPGALADCTSSVLKAAGASAADVWAVAADLTEAQDTGLTGMVGIGPRRIELAPALGDTGAASAALQLAAVLTHAAEDPDARGRLALIAAVDRDGLVGVAAFRCLPTGEGQ
jgi:3-oxoacyl-[acyl-carrier-protein] synthase II